MSLSLVDALKNYGKTVVSTTILKSPYEEIYNKLFGENEMFYENLLIVNQGVYISLVDYFETIALKEYNVTYIDENPASIQALNHDLAKFKRAADQHRGVRSDLKHFSDRSSGYSDGNGDQIQRIDTNIETFQSNFFFLKNNRFKNINYDKILIHHFNTYIDDSTLFFNVLDQVTHSLSEVILFVSVSGDTASTGFKNRIRDSIEKWTEMKLGKLATLEEVILKVPQDVFKIKHIIPYRESIYVGYGKNVIYQIVLEKV
jgi:hypothetical protein